MRDLLGYIEIQIGGHLHYCFAFLGKYQLACILNFFSQWRYGTWQINDYLTSEIQTLTHPFQFFGVFSELHTF